MLVKAFQTASEGLVASRVASVIKVRDITLWLALDEYGLRRIMRNVQPVTFANLDTALHRLSPCHDVEMLFYRLWSACFIWRLCPVFNPYPS